MSGALWLATQEQQEISMRYFFCLFLCILSPPAMAGTGTIFDYFESALWETNGTKNDHSCEVNPYKIRFSTDRMRVQFSLLQPVKNYLGKDFTEIGYDVLSHDDVDIVMAMDGETRTTPEGALVVWVLKRLPRNMYCWGRTDWPSTGCIIIHKKCPQTAPMS